MSESDGRVRAALDARPAWVTRAIPAGVGAVCLAAWVGLVGSLFAGVTLDEESGLFATALMLGITFFAALTAWLSASRARVVATIAAAAYATVFAYLRFGFDRMMPDAILYVITAVFYLSPLVAGAAAVVAGRRTSG